VRTPASTPEFDFAELRFDRGSVVLAAIGWGEWQMLERSLAEGLACESEAALRGEHVDAEELRMAVVAFRRSRRLLAGEEYLQWLAERSLSTADVIVHLKRATLRRRAQDRLDEVLANAAPTSERVAQAIDAEAILSGRLRSWSERLARCEAARRALGARADGASSAEDEALRALLEAAGQNQTSGLTTREVQDRAPRIAELVKAESAFRARVATPESIARRLREHGLDWQRLVWSEAVFRSEGAAREAALMVREDGVELDSVAGLAHADSRVREAYFSEVPELAELLSASAPGELVGPLQGEGGWRLARLRERISPSAEAPALRKRVIDELVEDALARQLAGQVSWHVER
jgi:hypothetical protein